MSATPSTLRSPVATDTPPLKDPYALNSAAAVGLPMLNARTAVDPPGPAPTTRRRSAANDDAYDAEAWHALLSVALTVTGKTPRAADVPENTPFANVTPAGSVPVSDHVT